MVALLALCAFADVPADTALEAPTPGELLEEARRRAIIGDFEGVRIVAEQAAERPGSHDVDARYLLGLGWEYGGDPARALAIYDALIPEWPADRGLADLLFRRAEALARDGRHGEALVQLEVFDPSAWDGADRVKLEILSAVWRLEDEPLKKPLRSLQAALDRAAPGEAAWYQGMARARLITLAVDQADRIVFSGSKRKKRRRLEARATLVTAANDQLLQLIPLESPRWTLQGLLDVSSAHVTFGEAMLAESRVRKLSDDQRTIYERERSGRVEVLWIKAQRYCDRALEYAMTTGWVGDPLPRIRAQRAEIEARIEAL